MFNLVFERILEDIGPLMVPVIPLLKAGTNRLVLDASLTYMKMNSLDSSVPNIELQGVISK